jgi:CRP-like cAMP-binding protein
MATRSRSPKQIGGNGVSPAPTPLQNTLLANLPATELAAFSERAKVVSFPLREVMFENGQPFERVFFPLTGMASLVTVLKDGTTLEAMTVGREGFVGLPLFHGVMTARTRGICQIEGDFYQLTADSFLSLLSLAPHLRVLLHRYSQYSNEAVAQSAACNSIHLIEQRCARWLLLSADAVGRNNFSLTHEFLAQMLAVRRPGVTVAIGGLERQGLIAHRYGAVTILDAEGLKKVSCECYQSVIDKGRELLGAI